MSSSFKKIFPVLILVVIFAGGYLFSTFMGDIFGGSTGEDSVASKAQAFQARLNYLNAVSGFDTITRDPRINALTSITVDPAAESVGRSNPFIR